jgi:ParB/RepB/Spo0J family partition protein
MNVSEIELLEIPTGDLKPHPLNRKVDTHGEEWADFARSVKERGIKQPLLVQVREGGGYEIIAGERRWRAARAAGFATVPVIVQELSEIEVLELKLLENLQRKDLDPVDEAREVRALLKISGWSIPELSKRIHRSEEWVSLRQGLLDLPLEAQDLARRREVALGVLQMVLHLPAERRDEGLQLVLHPTFQDSPLNVRQAEQILTSRIIEPAKAREGWETREGVLKTFWTVFLRELSDPELEPIILQVAPWETSESKPSEQAAENEVYQTERSESAPSDLRWVHLAQRHGLPVVVKPAKVSHGQPERDGSLALVDSAIIIDGERALEDHEENSAWLLAAKKGRPLAKIDLDAREDEAESETEDLRLSRASISGKSELTGWIDMGKVRELKALAEAQKEEEFLAGLPGWCIHFEQWRCNEVITVCRWIESLQGGEELASL